ncbi:MAG: hypothetical protein R2809_14580 [Flavobacteriales bacterium]
MIVLDQQEGSEKGWRRPEDVVDSGYNFKFSDYISEAIQLFKKDIANFVLFMLVLLAVNFGLAAIPIFGGLAGLVIGPPLNAGIFIVANKIRTGQSYSFNSFFDGFQGNRFGQLVLLGLISGILTGIGMLFCLIPGIYLAVSWSIAIPMLLFVKSEFWDAMEASRKVVGKQFWSFLGFMIVVYLGAVIIGLLACGVGLLFTLPIATLAIYCAFEDIMYAPAPKAEEPKVQEVPH